MAARLGKVLYWAACGIALVVILIGFYITQDEPNPIGANQFALVISGVIWMMGFAIKYVLAAT